MEDAVTFEELRESNGAITKSSDEYSFAGNVKAFENVVWQEIANGYEGFAEDATAAGCKLSVDTTSPMGESDEEGQLSILKDQVEKRCECSPPLPDSPTQTAYPASEAAHEADIPCLRSQQRV